MAPYTPSRLVRWFEQHLRAENRSERTVEDYLESLHQAEVFHHRGRRLEMQINLGRARINRQLSAG
jgi:hypothetical protein